MSSRINLSTSYFGGRLMMYSASVTFLLLSSVSMAAQASSSADTDGGASVPAKSLVALANIAANTEGNLRLNKHGLSFSSGGGLLDVPADRIISVTGGAERIETGGITGKIVRRAIPYGGGLALATVTQENVGLLAVEYLDAGGEYHGDVFVLNTADRDTAMTGFIPPALAAEEPTVGGSVACAADRVQSDTVRVGIIESDDQSSFPAEDRVLLYERLVKQLQSEKTIVNVFRAGSARSSDRCAEFTVSVRAVAFTKGDQAIRASTGPLGHFVGKTKISFHLSVVQQDGTAIVDKDLTKSVGGDNDSLNITKVVSKAVVKNIKNSRSQLRKS